MSVVEVERAALIEWGEWQVGSSDCGPRRFHLFRHQVNATDAAPLAQWHIGVNGAVVRYTLAGAEKKARELNGHMSNGQRLAAWRRGA